jgi:hypothetical protein
LWSVVAVAAAALFASSGIAAAESQQLPLPYDGDSGQVVTVVAVTPPG